MTDAPEITYAVHKLASGYEVQRVADGRLWASDPIFKDPNEAAEYGHKAAFAERERLGWPPGDPRIQFPERPGKASAG